MCSAALAVYSPFFLGYKLGEAVKLKRSTKKDALNWPLMIHVTQYLPAHVSNRKEKTHFKKGM